MCMKMTWSIKKTGYMPEDITSDGNRFLTGNGYMGIRGTLEEYRRQQLPAVNLAGICDQAGEGWREPLNAPNPLYTCIKVDGEEYRLPEKTPLTHECELDYRHGFFRRSTQWRTPRGNITVRSERFADVAQIHRIGMKYTVTADFHAEVEIITGIDGDVWDIHGPHYDSLAMYQDENVLGMDATAHEKGNHVYVSDKAVWEFPAEVKIRTEDRGIYRRIIFITEKGASYTVYRWAHVYTDLDAWDGTDVAAEIKEQTKKAGCVRYEEIKKAHEKIWEERWLHSEVLIEGDDRAMEALNYSLYHLHCIAPRHKAGLSIPARGLSGQTYKGAVFWDTEMFMLDFFLYTEPEVARNLMKYRIETLPGARKKAREYGYRGAFYAWESQEGGYDACSDYNVTDVFTGRPMRTYFRDKQYHISAAVVYGIMHYTEITGDDSLLLEGGAQTVLECAAFYYDLMVKKVDGERYEIRDCIGPDEYHERVNNNGYTNRMAKYTLESAIYLLNRPELLDRTDILSRTDLSETGGPAEIDSAAGTGGGFIPDAKERKRLQAVYEEAVRRLYLPEPDANGIIPQFDGYADLEDVSVEEVRGRLLHEKEYWGGAYGVAAHTKVIKQADVVTWLNMFPEDFPEDIQRKNWEYYEPRTEHGSSLSACMYAMLACRLDMADRAYPFFMKSAAADLSGGGKEWAGLVYIGGTHPAAAGGAYMTAAEGFAGMSVKNGEITVNPHLPATFGKMSFRMHCRGKEYQITVKKEGTEITPL